MTDQKNQPLTPSHPEQREENQQRDSALQADSDGARWTKPRCTGWRDVSGWDAYRRWLSRVQLPDKRRIAMDPALYTWKGYRNWAEKVRRDWTPEEK